MVLKSPPLLEAVLLLLLPFVTSAVSAERPFFDGKDIIVFMTDQERAIMHFPPNWEEDNLPGLTRLKKTGLTFTNAHTAACVCSPARATFLTGYFPAQHQVHFGLDQETVPLGSPETMPADEYPQINLRPDIPGLAHAAIAAGYDIVYKGKLHVHKDPYVDANMYNFSRWNPPDAGGSADFCDGGGNPMIGPGKPSWPEGGPNAQGGCAGGNNDGRYMLDNGTVENRNEGVMKYLNMTLKIPRSQRKPYFLVVSLINPHDVLMFPGSPTGGAAGAFPASGYPIENLTGSIGLPSTVTEPLDTKPNIQKVWVEAWMALAPLPNATFLLKYINFYGNLMKASDSYLVMILNALDAAGRTNDTVVIRTADHGELGLAHGTYRQKHFNVYKEALNVPMVFSNPGLWPRNQTSDALISHVDFVPTIARLIGTPRAAMAPWQGVDYSGIVAGKSASVQDYVVFTYDDLQTGSYAPNQLLNLLRQPNHIVAVIEKRYKMAKYFDWTAGFGYNGITPQYEMYDSQDDPNEVYNIALPGRQLTAKQSKEMKRLKNLIKKVEGTRLKSLLLHNNFTANGNVCQLQSNEPNVYFAYSKIYPGGNGTLTLSQISSEGRSDLLLVNSMGAVRAKVKFANGGGGHNGNNNGTSYVGVATFVPGQSTGFFSNLSGSVAIRLVTSSIPCNLSPLGQDCWSKDKCPGTISLGGIVVY